VSHRTGLNTEATGKILSALLGIQPQSPGRSARNQSKETTSFFYVSFCVSTRRGKIFSKTHWVAVFTPDDPLCTKQIGTKIECVKLCLQIYLRKWYENFVFRM
jgi:hypothetical protein